MASIAVPDFDLLPPEGRPERMLVVLMALLQGLLLYVAAQAVRYDWWWLLSPTGYTLWYALALALPAVISLSVIRLRDPRLWQHVLLILLVLVPTAVWAAWRVSGDHGLDTAAVLGPFGGSVALLLFIALPYLQCRQHHARWCAPYPELFARAWQNALSLLIAAAFTGLCWLVLWLWAGLFRLVEIDFFGDLFGQQPFVYLGTGTMAGLGLLIARTRARPVQLSRQILLGAFTGLLPLLTTIALLFAVTLPFTGLAPLWRTGHSAMTLLFTLLATVILVSATVQDGRQAIPYPTWLRRLVTAGLLIMPLYGVLALTAIGLRVTQYGWTAPRLYGAMAALVLLLYATGYALAALRSNASWLQGVTVINRLQSGLMIVLLLAVNTPLIDAHRLAVADQMARWSDGRTPPQHLDLAYLRFESGRAGYRAVLALREDARLQAHPELQTRLQEALASEHSRDFAQPALPRTPEARARTAISSTQKLREHLVPVTGSDPLPEALLTAMLGGDPLDVASCRHPGDRCIAMLRDLNADGSDEALTCRATEHPHDPAACLSCVLWQRTGSDWHAAGTVDWSKDSPVDCRRLQQTLRDGGLTTRRPAWPNLVLDGVPRSIQPMDAR